MKHTFYAQNPITIDGKSFEEGTVLATIEVADGVPVNRALMAIAAGQAMTNKPEKKKTEPAAETK